jgi:transcriptional regulator with XRE-family HTH domain
MPRPNQPRSIASEQALARRIADEREARGWSYDGLASRMTKVGCAIQSSAIYKIEKSDPPRRITVDELVGFSEVFGIPVDQLLLPPELAAKKELVKLITAWDAARVEAARANDAATEAWGTLQEYVRAHPETEEAVEAAMAAWMDYYYEPDEHRDWRLDKWVGDLTNSKARKERAAEKFHQVLEASQEAAD